MDQFTIDVPNCDKVKDGRYWMVLDMDDPTNYTVVSGNKAVEAHNLETRGQCLVLEVTLPPFDDRNIRTRYSMKMWNDMCFRTLKSSYEFLLNYWFGMYLPLAEDEEDGAYPVNSKQIVKCSVHMMVIGRRSIDRPRHY